MDYVLMDVDEANSLLTALVKADKAGIGIRKLSVAINEGGVKFKINENTWSPAMGTFMESE